MKLHNRIAFRYIFSKRRVNLINIISFISIVGITIGVAALICVMSIFKGFREIARDQIIGFDPHIRLSSLSKESIIDSISIFEKIQKLDGVESCIPVINSRVIATKGNAMQVFNLYAIPDSIPLPIPKLRQSIIFGNLKSKTIENELLLGAAIGDKLRAFPGDTVRLTTPAMIERMLMTFRPQSPLPVRIAGIYQTNQVYDSYAYTTYGIAKKLGIDINSGNQFIDLRLANPDIANDTKSVLKTVLGDSIKVETWTDLNVELYRVLDFERMATFIILSLIIIIAVFNVFASLAMTVTEKKANIAILKAIGAKDKAIQKVYLTLGISTGAIGTFAGTFIGIGLCLGQISFQWFKLDQGKYIVPAIPVSIDYISIIIIISVSMALTALAAYFPSVRAANTTIIQAIREE